MHMVWIGINGLDLQVSERSDACGLRMGGIGRT